MDAQPKWKITFDTAETIIRLSPFTISMFNTKTHANFSMRNMTTWYADKYKTDVLYLQKHNEILLEECFERNTSVTSSGTKSW